MRGVVYRIDFPDGYFYIGKTRNILNRMRGHFSTPNGKLYTRAKKYCLCVEHLMQFTSILYEGEDYSKQEFIEINKMRDDEFILNKDLVGVDVFRENAYKMGISMSELARRLGVELDELDSIRKSPPNILLNKLNKWHQSYAALEQLKAKLVKKASEAEK